MSATHKGPKGANTKGYIKNTKTGAMKKFIYNPNGFSDSRSVNYNSIESPGSSYPLTQFVNGKEKKITLSLYLFDKANKQVPKYIKFLEDFLPSTTKTTRFVSPPPLLFVFGSYIEKCVLTDLEKDYQEFDNKLIPTVVEVKLTLRKV